MAPASASADDLPARLGYVYLEANEGGSSGGHVALRFEDEVFHYQQESPGVLRLVREDWSDFLFRYTMLENRGAREGVVAVSDDTDQRLRDEFTRRFLVQTAQYDLLNGLGQDVALLRAFAPASSNENGAPTTVAVPALGYFIGDGDAEALPAEAGALTRLRQCVLSTYGADYTARRAAETTSALRLLRPRQRAYDDLALTPVDLPPAAPLFSQEYLDGFTAIAALRLIEIAPALRPEAVRVGGDDFRLDAQQAEQLHLVAAALTADLCRLAGTSRPAWGNAMLVGMARLAAIDASLRRGEWVVLDVYPADAPPLPLPAGDLRAPTLDVLEREAASDFEQRRDELLHGPAYREVAYSGVESALNRVLEAQAARSGAPFRARRGQTLPARTARRSDVVVPGWREEERAAYVVLASAAEERLRGSLLGLYRYDLLSRNCVSEIFDVIHAALPDDGAARLGGEVGVGANLNFIPIASENAVRGEYRVVERRDHPSYRQLRLEQMESDETAWRVWLRESNTLTAESYRPGPNDSAFLFFTQDDALPRPVFGTLNLLYGLGNTAYGLLALPLAGSDRLDKGLRGIAFSVPELAFINLRKGTSAYVERPRS